MIAKNLLPPARRWTAAELRQLPPDERDAILRAAAAMAEEEYRKDTDAASFQAATEEDWAEACVKLAGEVFEDEAGDY